jgi:hypothetical protein
MFVDDFYVLLAIFVYGHFSKFIFLPWSETKSVDFAAFFEWISLADTLHYVSRKLMLTFVPNID